MIRAYRAIFSLSYLVILALTACAPVTAAQTATPEPTLAPAGAVSGSTSPLAQYFIPPYYAPKYIDIVEASKLEDGLSIYGILTAANWAPIIDVFNSHYPWIKVIPYEMGTEEVFTRYYDEFATATRTADLVISSDQVGWQTFLIKAQALTYRSQEDLFVPDWSKPTLGISKANTGLYTVFADPLLIIYNKKLVSTPIESMSALAELATDSMQANKAKIVTYDAELNSTGFAANWFWINRSGETGWKYLEAIGKTAPGLENVAGSIVEAVGKGRASAGYFVPASEVFPKLADYPDLGWNYISDGQPILLRSMAVTQGAASPNSAKLMLDFILSQEGQMALAKGGLTPYRNDISEVTEQNLNLVAKKVGNDNIILFAMDDRIMDVNKRNLFMERWKTALQKPATP